MSYQPPPNGFRTFVIVWLTQSVSVFGTALTVFAINILLAQELYPRPEQKPELAFALTVFNIAFGLPLIFIAPVAGAWADRHDRKSTMIAGDFANGVLSLIVAALIVTHALQLWMLLIIAVLASILSSFHGSAFDTSYAMIVPEQQLPRANGMMQSIWSLSGILSPAIAAFLISLPGLARQGLVPGAVGAYLAPLSDGTPLAITVDAITFFLAGATLIFLFIPSPQRTDLRAEDGTVKKSIWADVKEGATYIWHRRPMLWLLGTFTVVNFLGSPIGAFIPLLVKFNLAADWAARGYTLETAFALIASIGAIGGVAGGFFTSVWGGLKRRRVYGVLIPMILAGLAQVVFGLSPLLYLTAAMNFIMDFMSPILNAHSQAIWQTQTPRELQGRVFAVRRLIAQFSFPVGLTVAGLATSVLNPGLVLAAMGAIYALFCFAQLFNRFLLRVEDKAWLDEMAAGRAAINAE